MALITPSTKNFDWEGGDVFSCPCCGRSKVDNSQEFRQTVEMVQDIRDWLGAGLLCTSTFRCRAYNKRVGGATNSRHIMTSKPDDKRFAMDLVVSMKSPRFPGRARGMRRPRAYEVWFDYHVIVAQRAKKMGFTGIGVYRGDVVTGTSPSMHLDNRPGELAIWGEDDAVEILRGE
jgi:hypothetical protein